MLIHIDGFDHYGTDTTKMTEGVYTQVDAEFTLSSANPRTGSRHLRRDNTNNTGHVLRTLDDSTDTLGTGLAVYLSRLPFAPSSYKLCDFRDSNGTIHIGLFIEPDGSLAVRLGSTNDIIATSAANSVTSGQYNHIEFACISDSGTSFSVTSGGNIASAVYEEKSFDVSAQLTSTPFSVQISGSGEKVFAFDNVLNKIFQYSLSTPFDITTASYDSKSFTPSQSPIHSIRIADSGTRLYLTDGGTNDIVYQYNLSTAFDISTAAYTGKSFDMTSIDSEVYDVDFNSDGTKMYAVGAAGDSLYQFSLSSAWDVTTASYDGIFIDASVFTTEPHAIKMLGGGSKIYTLETFGNTVLQFDLVDNFSLSAFDGTSSFSTSAQTGEIHGFDISSDGLNLYAIDRTSKTIYQYSIPPSEVSVSDGLVEARVNGVTYISNSNARTTVNGNKEYSQIALTAGSSIPHLVVTDIDDWYVWDDNGSWNNSFIGDRRCFLLKPNQDTNISDFDPSSGSFGYKMIDDESPDDDSTYIIAEAYLQSGSPLTGTSEFEIENLPDGTSLISAVNVVTRASKTDQTSAEIFTSINSGANSLSKSAHLLTTNYGYFSDIYEYDPSAISSLTRDGFNNLSVSITADDLDPGVSFDSPEDFESPTTAVFDPSDLFSGGQDGFWFDFSDTGTLWQDTSATSPVTTSGQSIARADDKTGNGYNATQGTASARPTFNDSAGVRWAGYDGSDVLTISSSTVSLNWLHHDVGIGIACLVRFGTTANPNALYAVLGSNSGSSGNRGMFLSYDDRASVPRNDNSVSLYSDSLLPNGQIYNKVITDGDVPAIMDVSMYNNIPAGGPLDVRVNNVSKGTAARAKAPTLNNASFDLQIGAGGNNTFKLVGRIYQIIVRDEEFSASELSDIENYFLGKL